MVVVAAVLETLIEMVGMVVQAVVDQVAAVEVVVLQDKVIMVEQVS